MFQTTNQNHISGKLTAAIEKCSAFLVDLPINIGEFPVRYLTVYRKITNLQSMFAIGFPVWKELRPPMWKITHVQTGVSINGDTPE